MTAWAELHLHLEGTLEPELIFALAERNGTRLPYEDLADLRSRYDFADLQSFLDLYYTNMQVLQTEQDFADLTDAYLARAQRSGIGRAEVFFDLQAHTARGIDPHVALGGVHRALAGSEARHGISTGLILTFLRHLPGTDAMDAYQQAIDTGVPLLGVGLCSSEVGFPVLPFAEVFDRARADGLRTVAHAGEEGDAGYVREALDILKVERVDHGVRSIEDPGLIERLVAERTPLTMCPLSNVRLKVVPTLAAHPIVDLLRQGVKVTVNSDDPAYFGGYLDEVVAALRAEFDLTDADIDRLARNSIEASFAPEPEKARLLAG